MPQGVKLQAMDRPFRSRYLVTDVLVATFVAFAVLVLGLLSSRPGGSSIAEHAATVLIDEHLQTGRAIPPAFLGLSFEYPAVEAYAGDVPLAVNPVLEQLIRNLTPGQAPVLRIGGDSTDWTWWPLPGVSRPPGVTFTLSPRWLQVTRALAAALNARLILGINLAAGSPELAAAEASALIAQLGPGFVQAMELGNEPELYGRFPWYRTPGGRGVTARRSGYDVTSFTNDFTSFTNALPHVALAGPAYGGFSWTNQLVQFLVAAPQLGLVTLHRYPLQYCFIQRGSPRYPTIAHLLSPAASTGLADSFRPYVAITHARRLPLRIDELNSVSCGADPAISNTFASALWALDTLFEMARVGVDAVNIHTYPGAGYELFSFSRADGRWRGSVAPEYYGLLMFAQATPPGSRLLAVSGEIQQQVKIWATRAPDGRIRVALINKDPRRARAVAVRAPGSTGQASLERLQAPSAVASTGLTLGGQSFSAHTYTGVLPGPPRTSAVDPVAGSYVVSLPAASAALLALPSR